MRIIPSPLVKELRGRAAGAVAAVTRGVNYTRGYNSRPANPQSAGQKLIRACMKLITLIWQHSDARFRAAWDFFAEGLPTSGVNEFTKGNAAALYAASLAIRTPSNPDEKPLASLALGAVTANTQVLNWVAGDAVATHHVEVSVLKDIQPTDPATVDENDAIPKFSSTGTVLVSAGTITATGLVTATDYLAFISVYDAATGYLSKSLVIPFTTS
jgi:hypothetical protein